MPLRVIVNDRPLRNTLTGVGNYIAQILLNTPADADVRLDPFYFKFLVRRDWRARQHPSTVTPAPPSGQSPAAAAPARPAALAPYHPPDLGGSRKPWWVRRTASALYGAAFRLAARGYDIYHEPNHIPMRCGVPTVTTVHDLSVLVHPEWHPPDRVRWYEQEFEAGVRQTRVFIAASEFTKREMQQRLKIAAERIVVTYQAPRPAFRPLSCDETERSAAALDLPRGYFLYVGTLEPRKNVEGLLEAYARLPANVRSQHPLLIVGAWGWRQEKLRAALEAHALSTNVRLLGYMYDDALAVLYSACTALVWPTLYEGFGLPPLEAMTCGAPVIVSNVASLPEVVGDAGVLLAPDDRDAWRDAMHALTDPQVRAARREKSLAQAARFSTREFIAQTLAAYRRACSARSD